MTQTEFQDELLARLSDILALTPDIRPGSTMVIAEVFTPGHQMVLAEMTMQFIAHTDN